MEQIRGVLGYEQIPAPVEVLEAVYFAPETRFIDSVLFKDRFLGVPGDQRLVKIPDHGDGRLRIDGLCHDLPFVRSRLEIANSNSTVGHPRCGSGDFGRREGDGPVVLPPALNELNA